MDKRPTSMPPWYDRPKAPTGVTLPSKPGLCVSCGSNPCRCKTMNHQHFLERKLLSDAMFETAMINQINMDCDKARRRIQDELTPTVPSSSSSSGWKRPPPPIIPVKPLIPPPPPPTNAVNKLTIHQLSARKKLAQIQENRRKQNQRPPPPPPPPRTPSPASSEKGEMISMDPAALKFAENWLALNQKLSSGDFGALNFPSWGDIKVPGTPPKLPSPRRPLAFEMNGNEEDFSGKNSAFTKPSAPSKRKGIDDEATTTGETFSYTMNPETVEMMKKMTSGDFGALNFPSWDDDIKVAKPPPKFSCGKPTTPANPPLPPPRTATFGLGENEEHFLGNKTSAKRPLSPPDTKETGGTVSYSMNPEALEFFKKMTSDGSLGALNFPSWMEDAIVPTTPSHLTEGSMYGFDGNTQPTALDLSCRGAGANDDDKSPPWSPTPSDDEKEGDEEMAPPPIPLGEIHRRPWYNRTSGYIIHSCLICSKGFAELEDLRRHEFAKHVGRALLPLYCDDCDRSFAFEYQYNDHLDEHLYCRCCGGQLKQAVLNGFQRAAAVMGRFMKVGGDMGLENICEGCKERERRIRALKRGASETVTRVKEEDDDYEEGNWDYGESSSEEEEDDEELDEEEESGEEEEIEDEDEQETENEEETDEEEYTDEEMDEEDYIEKVDNKVYIEEIEDDDVLEEKKVEQDIPENQLGDYVEVEEGEEVDEEEEYDDGEEEEVVEEEEDEDESMEDEETEEEEDE